MYFIEIGIQCGLRGHFLKMVSGRWWPSVAMHCWRGYLKFSVALRHNSRGIAEISSRIPIFKFSKLWSRLLNTFFKYLHRKKSQKLKSGERGATRHHPSERQDMLGTFVETWPFQPEQCGMLLHLVRTRCLPDMFPHLILSISAQTILST